VKQLNTYRSLGATKFATNVATVGSYTQSASNIAQNLGAKPTNATLNSVSSTLGTIAAVAAIIPGGQVVAGILGVAVGVATLLSSVFGGGPATGEQLKTLKNSNDILRGQIRTIDEQTVRINKALQTLQSSLQQNGLAGWKEDLIALSVEQSATPALEQQLADKGRRLQILIETLNVTVTNTYKAITTKNTGQKFILYGLVGLSAVAIMIFGIRKFKKLDV